MEPTTSGERFRKLGVDHPFHHPPPPQPPTPMIRYSWFLKRCIWPPKNDYILHTTWKRRHFLNMLNGQPDHEECLFLTNIYLLNFPGSPRTVCGHHNISRADRTTRSLVGRARHHLERRHWGCWRSHWRWEGDLWSPPKTSTGSEFSRRHIKIMIGLRLSAQWTGLTTTL